MPNAFSSVDRRDAGAIGLTFTFGKPVRLGGTERRAAEVVAELQSRGIGVECILLTENIALHREMSEVGARTTIATNPIDYLRRVARSSGRSPVVAFGWTAGLASKLARVLRLSRTRQLAIAQNGLDFHASWVKRQVASRCPSLVHHYIANSDTAAAVLRTRYGIPDARVAVLPSAIPAEWHAPATDAFSLPDELRIVVVATGRPEKNLASGLRTLSHAARGISIDLTVFTDEVGAGQVTDLNLPFPTLSIIDKRLAPADYDGFDVLYHPSLSESMPRVVLEALARRLFVIATDVGDTGSVLQPPNCVHTPGDVTAIRGSLREFAKTKRAGANRPVVPAIIEQRDIATYVDALLRLMGSPC